jgi:hypothetical protein
MLLYWKYIYKCLEMENVLLYALTTAVEVGAQLHAAAQDIVYTTVRNPTLNPLSILTRFFASKVLISLISYFSCRSTNHFAITPGKIWWKTT